MSSTALHLSNIIEVHTIATIAAKNYLNYMQSFQLIKIKNDKNHLQLVCAQFSTRSYAVAVNFDWFIAKYLAFQLHYLCRPLHDPVIYMLVVKKSLFLSELASPPASAMLKAVVSFSSDGFCDVSGLTRQKPHRRKSLVILS